MSSETNSPSDVDALNRARKQLACQIISVAFEDLKLWAAPYSSYRGWMREEAQLETFEETTLYELYFFFLGWKDEPSALSSLIQSFELDMQLAKIAAPVKPLLKEALIQFNACRENLGHIPFQL